MAHSEIKTSLFKNMRVKILPALSDNFMYLLSDDKTKEAAVVDPVDAALVTKTVEDDGLRLTAILTTHHHWDHSGGNKDLYKTFEKLGTELSVFGGDDRVPYINRRIKDGDVICLSSMNIYCLTTPCHTTGSISYYVSSNGDTPMVFTGDTLFVGGCGRFFEGTAEMMYKSLKKLGNLPDITRVFCGHEYTVDNLKFAKTVEPENAELDKKLSEAISLSETRTPTVPSTIGEEKLFNPFMRVDELILKKYSKKNDPVETMAFLREKKNSF